MAHPLTVTSYDVGDLVHLTATAVGTDGVPGNPSLMVLYVQNALGSVASYPFGQPGASVVQVATGAYWRDVTAENMPGLWRYEWLATGGIQAAEQFAFKVERTFHL